MLNSIYFVFNKILKKYRSKGGYKEFLNVAFPLSISTGFVAVQFFISRIFLSTYSKEDFVAATISSTVYWIVECFFLGTVSYVSVFISQYYGRKEYSYIGEVVWHGVYISVLSSLIIFLISCFTKMFFMNIGHLNVIVQKEIIFFKILCYGAFPRIVNTSLSGFFSGMFKTKIVLFVSIFGIIINIILDYYFIFGNFFFNGLGIVGAALATNISSVVVSIVYFLLIMSKKNNYIYKTRNIKFDFQLIKKILHYGLPNGMEIFFGVIGIGFFIIVVGTFNKNELIASNIISNICYIFLMPIIGFGMAISVITGKHIGENKIILIHKSVKSAIHISCIYVIFTIFILFFFKNQLIYKFLTGIEINSIKHIKFIISNLFIILYIYIVFDTGNIIFASVIKGAGDTVFVMKKMLFVSILFEIVPIYIFVILLKYGIYIAWLFLLLSVILLFFIFYFRYKSCKWKNIRLFGNNIKI
jgi:MATE family multidrug resistance protein